MTLGELAARIAADPTDGHALREAGLAASQAKQRPDAVRALSLAARAFSVVGQLPMALVATRELATLDAAQGAKLVDALGSAYGKGSKRVDPSWRARPPASPGRKEAPSSVTLAHALDAAQAKLDAAVEGPLPSVPIFSALGPAPFRKLASAALAKEVAAGARILDVGTPGDALFVVARGSVRIARPDEGGGDVVLSHLRAGSFFGEMALLTDSPRAASATAETPVVLLEIARRALDEIAAAEPEAAQVIADYARDRLLANLMLTSALFQPLSPEARHRLVGRFARRILEAGTALLDEGQPGGTLYVIVSGRIDVAKRDADGSSLPVAQLGPGDVVGEISLLTKRPATATAVAAQKTVVLALAREDFNAIIAEFPTVLSHLYQLADRREKDLERLLAEQVVEAEDYLI